MSDRKFAVDIFAVLIAVGALIFSALSWNTAKDSNNTAKDSNDIARDSNAIARRAEDAADESKIALRITTPADGTTFTERDIAVSGTSRNLAEKAKRPWLLIQPLDLAGEDHAGYFPVSVLSIAANGDWKVPADRVHLGPKLNCSGTLTFKLVVYLTTSQADADFNQQLQSGSGEGMEKISDDQAEQIGDAVTVTRDCATSP